jgi:multidrug efflux pump subunit AcrA (membrane-fusion protein)
MIQSPGSIMMDPAIKKLSFMGLLLALSACNTPMENTHPITENISESVYASGIVKSRDQYQAFAKITGIIQKIWVTEGDSVKKGDPIALLSNETQKLNTENAKLSAQFSDIQSNINKLNELGTNIDLARDKHKNDSLLMIRQQELWAQQIGTQNELDQRQLAYRNSKTTLDAAIFRYNDLKKQLDFAMLQSKKNLQISESMTGDYTIRSEMNGKVYSVLKKRGEVTGPQVAVAIIGSSNDLYAELQVDEYDIARVQLGQRVLLTMDSYKGHLFEAVINKINPIMNERSRSFTVEAGFVSKPPVLYPNLTMEANIVIQTKEHALVIPRNFLLNDTTVLVGKDEKRKVVTGLKDYQKAEIISGLSASDIIYRPAQ